MVHIRSKRDMAGSSRMARRSSHTAAALCDNASGHDASSSADQRDSELVQRWSFVVLPTQSDFLPALLKLDWPAIQRQA